MSTIPAPPEERVFGAMTPEHTSTVFKPPLKKSRDTAKR
jgi:hypothetical protein